MRLGLHAQHLFAAYAEPAGWPVRPGGPAPDRGPPSPARPGAPQFAHTLVTNPIGVPARVCSAAVGTLKRIAPILPVRDVTASLSYYRRLGFTTREYDG